MQRPFTSCLVARDMTWHSVALVLRGGRELGTSVICRGKWIAKLNNMGDVVCVDFGYFIISVENKNE